MEFSLCQIHHCDRYGHGHLCGHVVCLGGGCLCGFSNYSYLILSGSSPFVICFVTLLTKGVGARLDGSLLILILLGLEVACLGFGPRFPLNLRYVLHLSDDRWVWTEPGAPGVTFNYLTCSVFSKCVDICCFHR